MYLLIYISKIEKQNEVFDQIEKVQFFFFFFSILKISVIEINWIWSNTVKLTSSDILNNFD